MDKEVLEALNYLDEFEKSKKNVPVEDSNDEDEEDVLKAYHEKKLAACVEKAKKHKNIIDKIKNGEDIPDEAFEDEDDVKKALGIESFYGKEEEDSFYKGEDGCFIEDTRDNSQYRYGHKDDIGEIVKGAVSEALDSQRRQFDEALRDIKEDFSERLSALEDTPVRKSLVKGSDISILQKAVTGEKEDGKTILSASMQKSRVSDALYGAFEVEQDSIIKGKLGDAVAQYESSGYISPEVANIMLGKGVRLIK